jgi:SEC-C motif
MKIIVRNAPCPCGSGKKYKRCHGVQMPKASLRGSEAGVPSVYQPFAPYGPSPWIVEAVKRASRQ